MVVSFHGASRNPGTTTLWKESCKLQVVDIGYVGWQYHTNLPKEVSASAEQAIYTPLGKALRGLGFLVALNKWNRGTLPSLLLPAHRAFLPLLS